MWFLVLCTWVGCCVAAAVFIDNPSELTAAASVSAVVVYLVAARVWFRAIDEDWEVQQFTRQATRSVAAGKGTV